MAKRNAHQPITYTYSYSNTPMSQAEWEKRQRSLARLVAEVYVKWLEKAVPWCPNCPHPSPECKETHWQENVFMTEKALTSKPCSSI